MHQSLSIFSLQRAENYQTQADGNAAAQPNSRSPSSMVPFSLKWLPGTTVSRCYGCGMEIMNPPTAGPDDLIIVHRDFRCYRERETGQERWTTQPQNIHFHLRIACVQRRYPGFSGSYLAIPRAFMNHLRQEHFQRLFDEFGLTFTAPN